jgi:glycosyltransferase involved in cell wall biosynthesis
MSIPLACISSDCIAGPREIIQHGINGLLFETGNVNQLKIELELLIENKNLVKDIKKEAYKVRKRFTIENSFEKFENIIIKNNV